MDLVATNSLKNDLKLLTSLEDGVLLEFCRCALELLRKGASATKGFSGAAKKLGVSVSDIQQMCSALCHTLVEAAREEASEGALGEFFHELGFRAAPRQALLQFYLEHAAEIRSVGVEVPLDYPTYKALDWRLDIQVASRSLRNEAAPSFLLQLSTETSEGKKDSHIMQADYATLLKWERQVVLALQEASSTNTCRMIRHLRS